MTRIGMTHIMICDPHPTEDSARVAHSLGATGYVVESLSDGATFLEAAIANRPNLIVYTLCSDLESDLAVLRLLRRAQPDVALVLITGPMSLHQRSIIQALRPTFCSVGPTDVSELIEVVRAALRRREPKG
jgi:DNA-binding response OmpR family regulator